MTRQNILKPAIAVIPARGGSKRIPGKNVKPFCGIPMIERTIINLQESGLFVEIYVSTEDPIIKKLSNALGAKVVDRPAELADDHTPIKPVMNHFISKIIEKYVMTTPICCVFPCSPFLHHTDLVGSLNLLKKMQNQFVFSVSNYPHPIQRAVELDENDRVRFLFPENELRRTQDLPLAYFDAGCFYWGLLKLWSRDVRIHSNASGYVIPRSRAFDIDTKEDWKIAEYLYLGMKAQV